MAAAVAATVVAAMWVFNPPLPYLNPSQSISTHLNQSQPISTHLNPSQPILTHLNPSEPSLKNKDHQRMMVDPMLLIVQSLWSFLTAVTTTAVPPIAVIFTCIYLNIQKIT